MLIQTVIEISESFRDWAIQYLHELSQDDVSHEAEVAAGLRRAHEDCLKRLENLVRLKTSAQNADGSFLSDEEYGAQRTQLLKEKIRLEERLYGTGEEMARSLEQAEQAFQFACTASSRFVQGDPQVKRGILAEVSNLTLKDKILHIEANIPLAFLERARACRGAADGTFEPGKRSLPNNKSAPFGAPGLICRRRCDSN